ncbi:hypothetical protein QL965_005345 [Escherichia coli]|jgi:hypothetical protein|nr:hypothetical protein [Escherichia coli]
MNIKYIFICFAIFLAGCTPYPHTYNHEVQKTPILTEKRILINSNGNFDGKPLTGIEFNRIMEKKINDGNWKGYVVHSITAAPWNNTWSSKGLTIPTNISYAGTYNDRKFYENSGNDKGITSRDMAGWYGFHVDKSEITNHGGYVGVNAFGVQVDVETLSTRGASIIFGSTQINKGYPNNVWADINVIGEIPYDFNINELKIEYLAKITGISRSFIDVNSPTIFNPSDTDHRTQLFTGELLAARLINIKTGVVYPVKLEWVFRTREAFL